MTFVTAHHVRDFAINNPAEFKVIVDEQSFAISNRAFAASCEAKWKATLRDQFAMAAITGLLSNADAVNSDDWSWRTGTLADDAYAFAEDAIAHRSIGKPT